MDRPYVYKITHISTGMFYIGVRYSKRLKSKDLFKSYFTSSKLIRYIIDMEGVSSFNIDFIDEFDNAEQAMEREYILIKETIHDPLSLNSKNSSNYVYKPIHRNIPDCDGLTSYQKGARKSVSTKLSIDPEYFLKKAKDGLLKNPKENSRKANLTMDLKLVDGVSYRQIQSENMKKYNPMYNENIRKKVSVKISEHLKQESYTDKTNRLEKIKRTKTENGDYERHSLWMLENNPTKNTVWINNGKVNKRISILDNIPEGYVLGRLSFGVTRTERTCPFCGLTGKGPNMIRYHFEKCNKKE